MSNIHELGNMIFNLENRKNLKEVNFTKDAVREVLGYLKELYEIKNKEHEEDRRVVDLEAKLADLQQEQIAEMKEHQEAMKLADKTITNLVEDNRASQEWYKKQLAESEEMKESYRLQNDEHHLQLLQFYSRLGVEAFGADIHEKALETLMIMKEKLADKEKENELMAKTLKMTKFVEKEVTQDKISFALEQLEKVKEFVEEKGAISSPFGNLKIQASDVSVIIDNQIKAIKEMK